MTQASSLTGISGGLECEDRASYSSTTMVLALSLPRYRGKEALTTVVLLPKP